MPEQAKTYRAVYFDLDGTLLPMELDEFLGGYFKRLGAFMVARGEDGRAFKDALNAGTYAMTKNATGYPNAKVYWDVFLGECAKSVLAESGVAGGEAAGSPMVDDALQQKLDAAAKHWTGLFEEFYATDFCKVGEGVVPSQGMVDAVAELAAKGYTLVLATMPLFPIEAVRERIRWAGIDPNLFVRLTNYENSTAAKPSTRYYAENLAALGLSGSDVLMVGNNTVEDLAACKLGCDAYVVTDHLLDPIDFDLSQVKHGSAQEFLAWVKNLPACANPATEVNPGLVDAEATETALEQNRIADEVKNYTPVGMDRLGSLPTGGAAADSTDAAEATEKEA